MAASFSFVLRAFLMVAAGMLCLQCSLLTSRYSATDSALLSTGPNIIRVPFTLTGGLITIRARADSIEGNFFFDTGADKLLLNKRLFSGLRRYTAPVQGVTGDVQYYGRVGIDTLRFDNFLKTKMQADVIDLSHIEKSKNIAVAGLIGAGVFAQYEILFDYEASLIVMIRTDALGRAIEPLPGWEYEPIGAYPLRLSGHIASVYLQCGPKKGIWMGVDSGAEQNLLSNLTSKKLLKSHFDIRRRIKLRGAGQESVEVLSGMMQNTRLDTFDLKPMATILTNLKLINSIYASNLGGILGYEFLSQRPVSLNMAQQRLTFYKKPVP
jgi:hypothetical protein